MADPFPPVSKHTTVEEAVAKHFSDGASLSTMSFASDQGLVIVMIASGETGRLIQVGLDEMDRHLRGLPAPVQN